jgi:hypothetical protein
MSFSPGANSSPARKPGIGRASLSGPNMTLETCAGAVAEVVIPHSLQEGYDSFESFCEPIFKLGFGVFCSDGI